eukprot:674712_1
MSFRNAVPQNILLDRIEQEFSPEIATQISQYFGFHQFDEWFDIFDDINQSYEDCCCKTTLFEQLHVSDNDQKQKQYLRLKQCLHPCTTNEQTTQNIIGNGIKYICNGQTEQFIKDYRSGQVHEIVCQIRTHLGETFAQLFERLWKNKNMCWIAFRRIWRQSMIQPSWNILWAMPLPQWSK